MNIVLVEDDSASRRSMARFIRSLGHVVIECGHGGEALEVIGGEPVHLVLSDIRMPVIDGHELLRRIKGSPEMQDIVVILFTAFKDVNSAIEALRNGAYDYLLKPINPEELAVQLNKISEYLSLKAENSQLTANFNREVKKATVDLKNELNSLRKAYAREVGTSRIGVYSSAMREVYATADKLHRDRDIPVLIEGETGTGKEVVARYIHYGAGEVVTPFVALNCAAISPELFESELFGYESGAFTGSKSSGQKGKIELAAGGTLFLDEITQLNTDYQAKLLRVIQEREFYRVGGLKRLPADVRFICATNEDIQGKVNDGSFRQDLYYRLNIGRLVLPPLRKRKDEIMPLAGLFLEELREKKKTRFSGFSPEAAAIMTNHEWPGNVRELMNTIERVAFLHDGDSISPEHLDFLLRESAAQSPNGAIVGSAPVHEGELPPDGLDLDRWILSLVEKALERHNGNKAETARYLGISRRTLYTYLQHIDSRR